jgi:uncharacterized membrane protein
VKYELIFSLVIFSACTLPAEKETENSPKKSNTTVIESSDANAATLDTANSIPLPPVQKIKKPVGIYQSLLPLQDKIEQTIAFNSDLSYQLQEKYIDKKDSLVITEGTWTPSDGFIWLYKDQIVRGRYKWQGNMLQYYSPVLKKVFPMKPMQDAIQNVAWSDKGKEGVVIYGIGNEPFWSFEYNNKDTLSFLLAEWDQPMKMKISSSFNTPDSIGYVAQNDSTQLRVTVFPQFCHDGMSDFIYRNKVRVQYNRQVYNGCGIVYK